MDLRILARNRTLSYMVEYFVTAGEPFEAHIANATEVGSGYPDQTTTHLKIGIFSTIYNAWMCTPFPPSPQLPTDPNTNAP